MGTNYERLLELCDTYKLSDKHKNQISAFADNFRKNDPYGTYEMIRDDKVLAEAFRILKNTPNGYTELKEILEDTNK